MNPNYISYIQSRTKTHLTLVDKWWAMYQDDLCIMEA